jgi:hypothetical protein
MKTCLHIITRKSIATLAAGMAAAVLLGAGANVCRAQALPPGVQDVVKLAQAGVSDDIILSQIKNTGASYNLTADQIILLKNQGVSQPVIKALLSGSGAPTPATIPAPAAPPAAVAVPPTTPAPAVEVPTSATPVPGLDGFQTQLAPYGTWIQVPGYGLCWQPAVAVTDLSWRPYFNQGHWIYTDTGWSWQSDYSWGGIVFHYGRWSRFNAHWIWVPGYDWAPAWVCWREADGYCGWAPLPPSVTYQAGVGLFFNGHLALDVDFGLDLDVFTFVAYDHFWDYNLHPFLLPHDRLEVVFRGSRVANGYRMDHGRFVIEGLGHDHMTALTHHEAKPERDIHDSRLQGHGNFDDRSGRDDRRDQHSW